MKVCQDCGEEISTKDGENRCPSCEEKLLNGIKRLRRHRLKKEREDVMRSLGLVEVRGALGGVYWE